LKPNTKYIRKKTKKPITHSTYMITTLKDEGKNEDKAILILRTLPNDRSLATKRKAVYTVYSRRRARKTGNR
jgi:hypothetical protein